MTPRESSMVSLVIVVLALSGGATVAAEPPERQILVTFSNDGARKLGVAGVANKQYRKRPRYAVAAQARRDARGLAQDFSLRIIDDWPIKALGLYCVAYELAADQKAEAILAGLTRDQRVESVQPMAQFHTLSANDGDYNDDYAGLQHGLASMGIQNAHKLAQGRGITIAVIDTAVDRDHEDLAHAVRQNKNFVSSDIVSGNHQHGTAVASIISAEANNGKGIVGIAPAAKLRSLAACWADHNGEPARCNSFTLAKALDQVLDDPPDLVNMSLAGPDDPLIGRLLVSAMSKGIIVVAAASGSADCNSAFPADLPGVLGVTSAGGFEIRNAADERGIHLVAPGQQIMVALPNDQYDFRSGNSLAAAHVTGMVALLLERVPGSTLEHIERALRVSQERPVGFGVVNACRALVEIDAATLCE